MQGASAMPEITEGISLLPVHCTGLSWSVVGLFIAPIWRTEGLSANSGSLAHASEGTVLQPCCHRQQSAPPRTAAQVDPNLLGFSARPGRLQRWGKAALGLDILPWLHLPPLSNGDGNSTYSPVGFFRDLMS